MLFRQSAVTDVDGEVCQERAARMPTDVHAVLLGNGEIAAGFDASGLQGLNMRMTQYADTAQRFSGQSLMACNLHLYRDEALSKHYDAGLMSLLPCGWLDYRLTVDGAAFAAADIAAQATDWRRSFDPRTGCMHVGFALAGLAFDWRVVVARSTNVMLLECRYASPDQARHAVTLAVDVHFTLRDGQPIIASGDQDAVDATGAQKVWLADSTTATAEIYHAIQLRWTLGGPEGCRYEASRERLTATWQSTGASGTAVFGVFSGSDRDGTHTAEAAAQALRPLGASEDVLSAAGADWQSCMDCGSVVHLGHPQLEYLCRVQQYVLLAGHPFHSGVPLGTLWTRNFFAATFWDSFFACDGLLRTGRVEPVRAFCDWLTATAAPAGRPHYWTTWYDGKATAPGDEAYHVVLAFAGTAIRLYAFTRSEEDLRLRVYPYVHKVAAFLLDEALVEEGGTWHLKGRVAHDVGIGNDEASKHSGILGWAIVTIAKCAEYAARLGESDAVTRTAARIDAHFRAHPLDLSNPGMWDTWLPHLTGGGPHMDWASWWRHTDALHQRMPICLYKGQPWEEMTIATSCTVTGHPDMGLYLLREALDFVYGVGYFSEFSTEWREGWAYAPYPPATGAFLSCLLSFFVHGSLWDETVRVGVNLPTRWRYQSFRFERIASLNGAVVSGAYTPTACAYTVLAPRDQRFIFRIPGRCDGEPLMVKIDGQRASIIRESDGCVTVDVAAGEHQVTLALDVVSEHQVAVIEPMGQGRLLAACMAETGKTVRWVRSLDEIPVVCPGHQVLVYHLCVIALPGEYVAVLERCVRAGAELITLFHAAVPSRDPAMSALTGVAAEIDGGDFFAAGATEVTYALTPEGAKLLPALPAESAIPSSQRFRCQVAEGVEVLARDPATGEPLVTRRQVGAGHVWWIAAGNKFMERKFWDWHEQGRRTMVYGDDYECQSDLLWLKHPAFLQLMCALVKQGHPGHVGC